MADYMFHKYVDESRAPSPGTPEHGYWVFDCKDRADAIAWAARDLIPAAQGGSVEVHPIFEM